MIKKLQKKYALSEQGAKDLIKGCLACVLQNLSFMFPVGLLYYLVSDLMNGGVPGGKIPFYVAGCVVCIGLILLTTFFQYNATYFATYKESGIRRITLAASRDTVVFPPPDGPTKAVTSPCFAVKETSFNTVSPVL